MSDESVDDFHRKLIGRPVGGMTSLRSREHYGDRNGTKGLVE